MLHFKGSAREVMLSQETISCNSVRGSNTRVNSEIETVNLSQ